jgi:hypothetical protein
VVRQGLSAERGGCDSFPRSAWECRLRRSASAFPSASPLGTQSVQDGIPTRSVGTRKIAFWLALWLAPAMAEAQPVTAKTVPIDKQPYAIRVLLGFDPATRVDAPRRALVLDEWDALTRRFVGAPWSVEIASDSGLLAAVSVENLKAEDLKASSDKADKVWAIRVGSTGPTLMLEGRELDVETGRLGEVHRREVVFPSDLPRELLRLALAMFTPSAEVGESKEGGVSFLVKGASLPASSPLGEVAPVGTIFRALRIFPKPDGAAPEIIEVRYSYFRVDRLEGPVAHCEIIRGVGDPLTNRYSRENRLVALGIKPSSTPTKMRFIMKGDRQPAAGYRLIARSIPPGPKPTELGMTDREGRITIRPGAADSLVSLRLMAGNDEPMLDIPVMPGESSEERTIVFEPRPLTLALEAKLDALRDAIIDVVAVRSRLEARMKARLDGEDWPGLDEAIGEFRKLTPRDTFATRLNKIREDGQRQEIEAKTTVLTRNARAQLDETQGLIDRYLDDDMIRSYEDAASRAKAELARPKETKKKGK